MLVRFCSVLLPPCQAVSIVISHLCHFFNFEDYLLLANGKAVRTQEEHSKVTLHFVNIYFLVGYAILTIAKN